jgi:phosphohistidine phosphatase SixA
MSRFVLAGVLWFALSLSAFPDSLVVAVRHAEKVDESADPDLTEAGRARARDLAAMLADAGIEAVYSTDFIRTRDTARPLADALGLELRIYDGKKLQALATELTASPVRALVVGHSNTTPKLVEFLDGDPGPPIENDEYDRLYLVVIPESGRPTTTILRFGH